MNEPTRILILDDDPGLRRTLGDILQAKGFQPLAMATGRQALEEMTQQDIPLALIDLMLDDMPGLEALRRIRMLSPNTQCILITGHASQHSAIEAINLGAYSYVIKPYDADQLLLTIRRALEKQEVEAALRRSEAKYRRLHESMSDAFAIVDMQGRLVEWNHAYRKLLGYSDEELRQMTYMDLTPRRWHAMEAKIVKEQVIALGHCDVYEKEYCRKDGSVIPIELRTYLLRDDAGQPSGMWAIVRDICDRKRIQNELIRAREEWENIFHAIGHLTLILDPDYTILAMNRAAQNILGPLKDGVIGKKCHEVFHASSAPPAACPLQRALTSNRHETSEIEVEALNKTFVVSCTPVKGRDGKTEKIIHIATDITDRKRTEAALRQSEERYRSHFEYVSDAVYSIDRGLKVLSVSPSVEKLLGYKAEELVGRPIYELNILAPEYMEKALGDIKKVFSGESISGATYEFIARDGSRKFGEVSGSPLVQEGQVTAIVSVARDVTERKRLEEQLHQSQKLEAIGTLAGGVAHDFNNLLTVILGDADLLLLELGESHPFYKRIVEIREAGQRAAALTRQLLAFSRRQVIEPKILNLNDVVINVRKMLDRLIGENIRLAMELSSDLGQVKVDPGQIEQVVINLAVNAKDAMPEGGQISIQTANIDLAPSFFAEKNIAHVPGPYVVLKLADTGAGMTPEVLSHVFEPFFTTKKPGSGTGLGLATVYGIVKQNKGFIFVASEPGKGAQFSIYLPMVAGEKKVPKADPISPQGPFGDETVLVVEDDAQLRAVIAKCLKRCGYRVVEAEDVESALIFCDRHRQPIHLLLTDVVMPGKSGKDLADRLTLLQPAMKVLFMSGYTDEGIARYGVLEPGISLLQKPFSLEALANRVREVLDRKN
jgi:PAS domain S-box-containing protein